MEEKKEADESYTLQEIKAAFWTMFHKSGERWFNYLGTEEQNEDSTRCQWVEFKDGLKKESPF